MFIRNINIDDNSGYLNKFYYFIQFRLKLFNYLLLIIIIKLNK